MFGGSSVQSNSFAMQRNSSSVDHSDKIAEHCNDLYHDNRGHVNGDYNMEVYGLNADSEFSSDAAIGSGCDERSKMG